MCFRGQEKRQAVEIERLNSLSFRLTAAAGIASGQCRLQHPTGCSSKDGCPLAFGNPELPELREWQRAEYYFSLATPKHL